MNIKAAFEGVFAGVISTIFSYGALISSATVAAIAIRRKMPDAWFLRVNVWHATFVVLGVSMVIGGVACRMIYKHVAGATPKA
jgi:uncharacterized membrane protein